MIELVGLQFAIFDFILFFILITSSFVGYHNGLFKELLSVFIWFVSILTTFLFIEDISFLFYQVIKTEIIVQICSFLIPLSLFFILFSILFKFLFENLKEISNFKLNKFLGLVFGFIKGFSLIIFCFGGLVYLFNSSENFPKIFVDSYFFEPVKLISIKALEYLFSII